MSKCAGCILWLLPVIFFAVHGGAQSYHAFNGSPYAGVTAMYSNPSATVNQAYKWDVTLLGFQAALSNNAFTVNNNSVLQTTGSTLNITNGIRPRYLYASTDLNLLNARYSINTNNAVGFGFRLRSYNYVKTAPFYYNDTITSMHGFLHANNNINFLDGYGTHTGWAEINFNYAHVIFTSASSLLSAGITLSYLKSLSGAFAVLSHANYTETKQPNGNYTYAFNQAGISAAYSANYLISANGNSSSQNLRNFLSQAPSSAGIDIGAEYLLRTSLPADDKDVDASNYDWKIGVSIMDIGRNNFNPIQGSFNANRPLGVADSVIQQKIQNVKNIRQAQDSLATIFASLAPLQNKFHISLPTRLIINIDHSLGSHFFVNCELSLNFYSTAPAATLHTRELNLLTITPRWETQAWGVYLPVQYNTQGQFWLGGAVKLGPLLLGVHNLNIMQWFKTGAQTYNGGGYILLSIHPFNHPVQKIRELDCPK